MIYGSRVRQARELRGVSQTDVASVLGVSASRVSQIESGEVTDIDAEVQAQLAALLRVTPTFFEVPIAEGLSDGSMRFRARKSATKRQLAQVRRSAELAHEMLHLVMTQIELPPANLPVFNVTSDIEEAASASRAAMGIDPKDPIRDVGRALERAGVLIYVLPDLEDDKLDAFSTWPGPFLDRPIIAVSGHLSWDRDRLTKAHELAHLVMHRSAGEDLSMGRDIERDANRFASAFLFPAQAAYEQLPEPVTLARLMPLKVKWGLSLGALVMRAQELQVINAADTARLSRQISARGWKKAEPAADARVRERPRALRRILELAFGDPIDIERLARQLGRYPSEVRAEIERYSPAPGQNSSNTAWASGRRARPVTPDLSDGIVLPMRPKGSWSGHPRNM